MKKQFLIGVISILILLGMCVIWKTKVQKDDWGITMKVTGVSLSRKYVNYKLRRNGKAVHCRIYTSNKEEIERWTLEGWERLDRDNVESTTIYELQEPHSEMSDSVPMYYKGNRLPMGFYRITKTVTIEESNPIKLQYSCQLFLASWWENFLIIAILALFVLIYMWSSRSQKVRSFFQNNRKRILLAGVILIGITLLAVLLGYKNSSYQYERKVVGLDGYGTTITDAQAKYLQLHHSFYQGVIDREEEPEIDSEAVALTDVQREEIKNIFKWKTLKPYPYLQYRYDAVIMYGNEVEYQIDIENGYIFWAGGYVGYTQSYSNPKNVRGYVEISEEEVETLKAILGAE